MSGFVKKQNHAAVVVVTEGECESRAVCGICKLRGKICFGTFPLNVFSTALIFFFVSEVNGGIPEDYAQSDRIYS